MRNKGFMMIEMLLSMCILASGFLLILPLYNPPEFYRYYFVNDYLMAQANAMKQQIRHQLEIDNQNVYTINKLEFNEYGHINQAQTVTVFENIHYYDFIVQVGGGRIVSKE